MCLWVEVTQLFPYYWCVRHVLSEVTLFLYKFTIPISFLHSLFTPVWQTLFLELALNINETFFFKILPVRYIFVSCE